MGHRALYRDANRHLARGEPTRDKIAIGGIDSRAAAADVKNAMAPAGQCRARRSMLYRHRRYGNLHVGQKQRYARDKRSVTAGVEARANTHSRGLARALHRACDHAAYRGERQPVIG